MQAKPAVAVMRRLYNIALYDNHVPQQDRDAALKLADALARDLETTFAANPQMLAELQKAIERTKDNASRWGCGSLVWMLNEHPMPAKQVVPFIMKPEHRRLVADYLETLSPDNRTNLRRFFAHQLVMQSDYASRNAVLVLHGLAVKGDPAAIALFTPDEYAALLKVPYDYDAGRRVLVGLGLLSAGCGKLQRSIPPSKRMLAIILNERKEQGEADARLTGLDDDKKTPLLLALVFLRNELTRGHLLQACGQEVEVLSNPGLIQVQTEFAKTLRNLETLPAEHASKLYAREMALLMSIGNVEGNSQEEYEQNRGFLAMAVDWLNKERVEFLDYLRFMLRLLPDHVTETTPEADREIVGFLLGLYAAKTPYASANPAQKVAHYEDLLTADASPAKAVSAKPSNWTAALMGVYPN